MTTVGKWGPMPQRWSESPQFSGEFFLMFLNP